MTFADFQNSLQNDSPPAGLAVELKAMWYAGKGEWDASHDLCQESTQALDWVHAWLHRQEGDLANAGYWYRRANQSMSNGTLEEEWAEISKALLASADA